MAAWRRDGWPEAPNRAVVLFATQEHDNGWLEEDAAPIVDGKTGRLLDFIGAPDETRQRIWPRAVERLRDQPYAAALVAHHAISVFERYRELMSWDGFFSTLEDARRAA